MRYTLSKPTKGTYSQSALTPGAQIQVGTRGAVYSGSMKGKNFKLKYGLTAAHVFEAEGDSVYFHDKQIGKCIVNIPQIDMLHSSLPLTFTVDMSFLELILPPARYQLDVIQSDAITRRYNIRIWKQVIVEANVVIVNRNREMRFGKIVDVLCTVRSGNVMNALAITDERGTSAITEAGDSGALVTHLPGEQDDGVLDVLGIVVGVRNDGNGNSMTIANRLWDVLKLIGCDERLRRRLYIGEPHPSEIKRFAEEEVDFAEE